MPNDWDDVCYCSNISINDVTPSLGAQKMVNAGVDSILPIAIIDRIDDGVRILVGTSAQF